MPYPQDLVGKFIAYKMDPGVTIPDARLAVMPVNGVLPGRVTDLNVPVYTFKPGLAGVGRAPPTPPRWINTNTNWSFAFLQYVAGAVTVASHQKSVLTGPMSGCFLFKYSDGGPEMVAHVGTANAEDSAATKTAKDSWRHVASLRQVSNIAGASPVTVFSFGEISAAMLEPGHTPMVAGYFDRAGPAYSILLSPVPTAMKPPVTPMLKVSAVKQMPLTSWNTIRNFQQWT
jgi:hypothetical protein